MIGQHLMVGFRGTVVTPEFRKFLEANDIGGVVLFAENCRTLSQIQNLTAALSSVKTSATLLIAIDHEGGRVHRLPEPFTHFPPAARIGAASEKNPETSWAFEVGKAMALELSAAGIHLDFAPVLDVWTNPSNQVIADRAFGNTVERVSRLGIQMIQGLQEHGVAACGKHFPGHGDTDADSHETLPRLAHNFRRIETLEVIPFRQAVSAGVASLMTAHVVYNGYDRGLPATLSVKTLRDLLRTQYGFAGVVFSDDLEMKAITNLMPMEEAAVAALLAGCDSLLVGRNLDAQERVVARLRRAVASREIPPPLFHGAAQRIARLKKTYCRSPEKRPPASVIGSAEHRKLASLLQSV